MPKPHITILGKTVRQIAKLRGGGSALPGLVVERIDPSFIKDTLSSLKNGVVVVSGTNGKTTTTKMVVELLEGQGLKVFTNRTGSNFTRGVAAALIGDINIKGELNADIAVLELDEAHGVHFVKTIQPKYSLILNVMRDQLDRFGEIDKTTSLLNTIAQSTINGVVLNREDARIAKLAEGLKTKKVSLFGLNSELLANFPTDDHLHGGEVSTNNQVADVELVKFDKNSATFKLDGEETKSQLQLSGAYNIYNAAAALALVRMILGKDTNTKELMKTLSNVRPAFGRGEVIELDGQPIEIVLVKNPSGFRLGLKSFDPENYATMIVINDNYADGRDMSWLWDVDFSSLKKLGVQQVSGIRAHDMALRLHYDEVPVGKVGTSISGDLKSFLKDSTGKPKRIYCTYTAMLSIRRQLAKKANVEKIA